MYLNYPKFMTSGCQGYGGYVYYIFQLVPICSMHGIFTYIYPKNGPNGGKYSIHGAYGVPPWIGHLHIFGKTQMIQMDMRATLSGRMVNPEQVQFFSNEKYCLSIVFLLPLYASYLEVRMPRNHCLSSAS